MKQTKEKCLRSSTTVNCMSLSDIVGEAMLLEKNEYQELNAEVTMTIKLKDKQPKVWWD